MIKQTNTNYLLNSIIIPKLKNYIQSYKLIIKSPIIKQEFFLFTELKYQYYDFDFQEEKELKFFDKIKNLQINQEIKIKNISFFTLDFEKTYSFEKQNKLFFLRITRNNNIPMIFSNRNLFEVILPPIQYKVVNIFNIDLTQMIEIEPIKILPLIK